MRAMAMAALLCVAFSCSKSGGDSGDKSGDQAAPAAAPAKKKSNIIHVQTAVPYGKQVACADVFDPAVFSKAIGDEIGEIKDRSSSNKEASLSCAFMRAGEPPKTDAQLRAFKKNLKLGVLPGDEYCTVTATCSIATDVDRFKKSCQDKGDTENDSLGQFACVHQTQRGTEYAYTYQVIDPDTHCLVEVMGGPSVTEESLVQHCASAALDSLAPDKLTNAH